MAGKLFICGTPIGNLEDITFRVLKTLENVDVIYAEDTRHTIKLLTHFEISKPLYSYHEHNKREVGEEIIKKLKGGDQIALVSDAGMPGISDPGEDIIKSCIEASISFEIIPGVTAFTTALVGSGLNTRNFSFEGFLDRDKRIKKETLERLLYDQRTLIFYESPHRLKETIKIMGQVFGEKRKVVLAKELTKRFETYFRSNLGEVMSLINPEQLKGEWVILVSGSEEEKVEEASPLLSFDILSHLKYYESNGMSKKEAMKAAGKDRGLKKSEIYKMVVEAEADVEADAKGESETLD